MFNIIFCDDNTQYLLLLKSLVENECKKIFKKREDFTVGPAFGSGKEVIEYVKKHHVDVLLLDIDMPDLSGFEVAKIICAGYKHIKIVFMSAYDNFVYSSFEFYPVAYLRKAHISKEFPQVLKRIVEKMRESERKLILATKDGPKTIDINSIAYVESNRNYYTVNLIHGKKYVCRGTLTNFEAEVCKGSFYRIHSAFLVNLEHIERILENGNVLIANESIPIAQRRISDFKKAYMDYVRRSLLT